jgi:hypothetical protein
MAGAAFPGALLVGVLLEGVLLGELLLVVLARRRAAVVPDPLPLVTFPSVPAGAFLAGLRGVRRDGLFSTRSS